ncbi:IQ-DOMAIN 14-like isoform X3 [Brachionus plicatilis]|uniref:IQ-DOMAIN 14-like isoform X3 n=1 Tax=Brachionus plicatilis TaxID=10195 RepID=A0A3M7Q5C6_BRAPC|nr:IQ-DOMAIN 14-like isoform X3 [Brachionus plicatilis]
MSKEKTSNVLRETTFGWFPIEEDKAKRSPIDVYMNLGSRHPKEESFVEEKILKEHIRDANSELIEKKTGNDEHQVDPPWALCHKPLPNKPIESNNEEVLVRSKSAPISYEWKPKKLAINIPKAKLTNLFDREPKHTYFSFSQKISTDKENKTKPLVSFSPKLESEEMEECSKEIVQPSLIESFNVGKKPLISQKDHEANSLRRKKARPKTAAAYDSRSSQGHLLCYNKRPKSTISLMPRSLHSQMDHEEKFKSNEFLKSRTEAMGSRCSNNNELVSEKPKTKSLLENWKSNLLEREKFLHPRPNYFVRIDMNKLQPDERAPQIHYNSPDTYFLNTMPFRKATFTIDPSFISENLNVQKIDLKRKESNGSKNAVRYRREFAFVY